MLKPPSLRALTQVALLSLCACGERDDGYAAVEKSLASILATISATSGDVQAKRATQGVWSAATTATPLYPGDWVRTGKGAWARIDFVNGSAVELEEDAVLVVEALERLESPGPDLPESAPLLAVQSGSVRSTLADRAGKARPLLLRTADGARSRVERKSDAPAELRVAQVDGATEVSVSKGEVTVATDTHQDTVTTGAAAAIGRQGAKKVILLEAPVAEAPAAEARIGFVKGTPLVFSWQAVDGATVYRAQISNDPAFRRVLFAREVGEVTLSAPFERPGTFWWRVAARDPNGRQSLFAPARRFFLEKQAPTDALLEPLDSSAWGFGTAPPRIGFTWRPREGVKSYRLVISRSAGLTTAVVASEVVQEPQAQVDSLQPGEYFWGVFTQGPNPEPLFLSPRKLTVKKVSAGNLVVPKAIKKWGE